MDKPQLFVVAGPNGAGKSSFSNLLVGSDSEVFDGDKLEKQLIESQPNASWERIRELSAEIFEYRWKSAIEKRGDFAYETNFTFPTSIRLPTTFKTAGYEINLLYVGLNSVNESTKRVKLRTQKGGHDVDNGSIELNFNGGIFHVIEHFAFFNRLLFIDNPVNTKPRIVLYAESGVILRKTEPLPGWVTTHFAEIVSF